ncbi:MAG: SagB/ThcOx family dehydrogenase [Deltaproteobacteria bacterium]|nr:SagB/ThcOx family dehydrogenase [Deltaproteobacteria bacterium]
MFSQSNGQIIQLPRPNFDSAVSVEQALSKRRSVRQYGKKSLNLSEISQLLWAAQGITAAEGFRTAPSAGALYPLEVYAVAGNVTDLTPAVYRYRPQSHELEKIVEGDKRKELCQAAMSQPAIENAPAIFVFTAIERRTTIKYRERGIRYLQIEVGHAAQNIALQAVSLGLGTVPIGAFDDSKIGEILNCQPGESPLYLMPIGSINKK